MLAQSRRIRPRRWPDSTSDVAARRGGVRGYHGRDALFLLRCEAFRAPNTRARAAPARADRSPPSVRRVRPTTARVCWRRVFLCLPSALTASGWPGRWQRRPARGAQAAPPPGRSGSRCPPPICGRGGEPSPEQLIDAASPPRCAPPSPQRRCACRDARARGGGGRGEITRACISSHRAPAAARCSPPPPDPPSRCARRCTRTSSS